MGDTLLPEIGIVVSLYVVMRSLEIVLGPNRQTCDGTVYAVATVTTVVASMAVIHLVISFVSAFFIQA